MVRQEARVSKGLALLFIALFQELARVPELHQSLWRVASPSDPWTCTSPSDLWTCTWPSS